MRANRIGSACWYKLTDASEWAAGTLHGWGTDSTEGVNFEQFPVGVAEDSKTLCVHSIYVNRICFASIPPENKYNPFKRRQ